MHEDRERFTPGVAEDDEPRASMPRRITAPVFVDDDEDEEGGMTAAERSAMYELYAPSLQSLGEGEIVRGKVLHITDNEVLVDVGFKSEGVDPARRVQGPRRAQGRRRGRGLPRAPRGPGRARSSSRRRRPTSCASGTAIKAAADESDEPVEGTLVKKIKGGVVVDLMGVDAFLPGSQIALRRVPNIDELLGQTLRVQDHQAQQAPPQHRRVAPRDPRGRARRSKREHLMKELAVRTRCAKGVVKNITDFGAFIDLGGVDGLLHITDMSWGRVSHPTEMVADRRRGRGQDPRHRLASASASARPEAAPAVPVEGRRREVPGRHARPGQGRLDHQLRRLRRARAGHRGPGAHLRDELDAQRAASVEDREHRRDDRGGGAQGRPSEEKISLGMKQTEQDPWMMLPLEVPGRHARSRARSATSPASAPSSRSSRASTA